MFKVKVITQGMGKTSWLEEALAEYTKRLRGKLEIEWILCPKEEQLIQKGLLEKKIIALDVTGNLLTSEELSQKLFLEWGTRPTFVIGGAEGLPSPLRERAFFRWSLSPLTFTHQMVRLILMEQLYRAIDIGEGGNYHK